MPIVNMKTSLGVIKIALDPKAAPKTVANFEQYCNEGFYNNTLFHRVIRRFMVQGGGLDANMTPKPTNPPIDLEADNGLPNDFGTVAMARTQIRNSATSQFYINTNPENNDFLNGQYAVFGKVIEGMDVVLAINDVNTTHRSGYQDVPEQNIFIESVSLELTPEEKLAAPEDMQDESAEKKTKMAHH